MKKIFLLVTLLVVFSNCSSDDATSDQDKSAEIEEQLNAIIAEKVGTDADKLVGVSISIRVDGEERWNLQGGLSRLNEPITSNMRFGVGSVTKTVVAATIMKLVDEGILTLNDTIDEWLDIDSPNVDNTTTIFELLIHASRINGYMYPELWDMVEADFNTAISQETLVGFIGPPLQDYAYSNSNYLLLGLIIEEATGKTVGQVMREKFWTPLGLNNIYFGTNEPIQGTLAAAWRDSDGDGVLEDITNQFGDAYHSVFYCAADIFSTASDLSMWAHHLYGGNAVSESSRNEMMTSYYNIPDPVFTGYGLGSRRNVYAGTVMWGHTGGMRGYGSAMFYDPINKVSIAMLNNQSRSSDGPLLRYELVEELLRVVFNSL